MNKTITMDYAEYRSDLAKADADGWNEAMSDVRKRLGIVQDEQRECYYILSTPPDQYREVLFRLLDFFNDV